MAMSLGRKRESELDTGITLWPGNAAKTNTQALSRTFLPISASGSVRSVQGNVRALTGG